MARTLPPYNVPSANSFNNKKGVEQPIESNSDASSTELYLSSDESVVNDTEDADSTYVHIQNSTDMKKSPKEHSTVSKEMKSSSIKENTPFPKMNFKTNLLSCQALSVEPNLKNVSMFNNKLLIIHSKEPVKSSSKKKKLRRRPPKTSKISLSENKRVSKFDFLEDSMSISAVSENKTLTHENALTEHAYSQPSTSQSKSNMKDANMVFKDDSPMSTDYASYKSTLNQFLKINSEFTPKDKLSFDDVTPISANLIPGNNAEFQSSLRKIEKVLNKNFCRDYISGNFRDISKIEGEKVYLDNESHADHSKKISSTENVPEEILNCTLSSGKVGMISQVTLNQLSPAKNRNEIHDEKYTDGPNLPKLLPLKETFKTMLSPSLSKSSVIPKEKSTVCKLGGRCTDYLYSSDSSDKPPKISKKNKSVKKLTCLRKRKKRKNFENYISFFSLVYSSPERRYTLENLFYKYSEIENPWRIRVLSWISSVIPELSFTSESVIGLSEISGTNLYKKSAYECNKFIVENIDASLVRSIVTDATEEDAKTVDLEEIDVETIDMTEEINVETKKGTNEKICNQSCCKSSKSQSSVSDTIETPSSDFHSSDTESSEKKMAKSDSLDSLLSENESTGGN